MFLSKWPRYTLALSLFFAMATAHTAVAEDIIITPDSARFHQPEGWGVEAEGNPVTLRDGSKTNARAQKLVYRVAEETITLTENAHINNEGRTFEGARVVYHLNTQNVEASGQKPGERVRLVIPGEKKK